MADEKKPEIEFPCDYPIKVMGLHENDFATCVVEIITRHAPEVIEERISYRESSGGRYLSVNVVIIATGKDQLQNIFEDLKASGRVKMVL